MDENIKTICKIIEEVSEDICSNYCKYGDILKATDMTDKEYDAFAAEHCDKCPLNRL